jgi:hypothetical protein
MILKGVRSEREGRAAEALTAYRDFVALPLWRRDVRIMPAIERYARWRIDELGK